MKLTDKEIKEKYDIPNIKRTMLKTPNIDRLKKNYEALIERLTVESNRHYLREIDWDDDQSIKLRNSQMTNLKNLLSVTKSMNEVIEQLIETQKNNDSQFMVMNAEAKAAMKQAQKLLKMRANG